MKNRILWCLFTCLLSIPAAHAQADKWLNIKGIVTDLSGNPLPGVLVRETSLGVLKITSSEGAFSLPGKRFQKVSMTFHLLGFADYSQVFSLISDTILTVRMAPSPILTDEITVSATRAGTGSGIAFSNVNKEDLTQKDFGQDIPYLLQLTPSAVATSDAGNSIGYTGIRIRGSDPSRTNVTVNGIPLNDAESQLVYWVDLPDLTSSIENIQIQRGAGVSTNGAGAFGASINLLNAQLSATPAFFASSSAGSFNSTKQSIRLATGTLSDNFRFSGNFSKIHSDGFIDRGRSDLESYSLSGSWSDSTTIVRMNLIHGLEETYQCWNGVPISRYLNDEKGMQDFISRNYLSDAAAENLLHSGRTYNEFTYANQIDHYGQDHYQLLASKSLSKKWLVSTALHYTRGKGYYEEFKEGQDYLSYGLILTDSLNKTGNLVRRKWLDNDFYGGVANLQYQQTDATRWTFGSAFNRYIGGHYGEVIRADAGTTSVLPKRYYDDDANKADGNIFLRIESQLNMQLAVFGDIQFRSIHYAFTGLNDLGVAVPRSESASFFNPKAGFSWKFNSHHSTSLSFSTAAKEPGRDDFAASGITNKPKPEYLYDGELGYAFTDKKLEVRINGYFMYYRDQLVLTGEINDVGNYTRNNVAVSYRRGIEVQAGYQLLPNVKLEGNLTFSENRIRSFSEFVDTYIATDTSFESTGQIEIKHHNTSIAFSPSLTAVAAISWQVTKDLRLTTTTRHVGKQYLDNTESSDRMLSDYTICDAQLDYRIRHFLGRELTAGIQVNNLFDRVYTSNGYTWGYAVNEARTNEVFVYPQAGINFMGRITVAF